MYISRKRAEELAAVWGESSSLKDAISKIGLSTDARCMHRCRRDAEKILGIELPTINPEHSTNQYEIPIPTRLRVEDLKGVKKFIVTSAQNNTAIRKSFLSSILQYCEAENARLLVLPVRYKNPNALDRDIDNKIQWPSELLDYILTDDLELNKNIKIDATRIQATAINPLSGMNRTSNLKSRIFGHAQVQMEMIATPSNTFPKMIHTTGSISQTNYSDTKQGRRASEFHSFGALVVECNGSKFWVRQITEGPGGAFYDLDKRYAPDGVTGGHRAEAIVLGDEHVKFYSRKDKNVVFFNKDSICNTLKPKFLVRHDVHDHYSGSHHHKNDHILQMKKFMLGDDDVKSELDLSAKHINETTPGDCVNYVVDSNHHDHLTRWVNEVNPKRDLRNAPLYYELMSLKIKDMQAGNDTNLYQLYLQDKLSCDTVFRHSNVRLMILGIDCSQHGDRGPNGTRGSIKSFSKHGAKMIIGHSHTPGIEKNVHQVGTSTLDLEYVKGLSSWVISHCVIYPDGARALINVVRRKWRL